MVLNSGSHACMQVLLLTEPSSQTCDSLRLFTLMTMVELPLRPCQLAMQHALKALVTESPGGVCMSSSYSSGGMGHP